MYPHERSLVKKLANKPFALLGINSDNDRDELKKTLAKERITWRSWWDGSVDGPIANRWDVNGWPTVYVLDARGVIRFMDLSGEELDTELEKLLKELEGEAAPK